MEFLANENFPFPSTELLRAKGYKVRSIVEENRGITDEEVMQKAVLENLIYSKCNGYKSKEFFNSFKNC